MALTFGHNTLYKLRPKKILDQAKVNVKLLVGAEVGRTMSLQELSKPSSEARLGVTLNAQQKYFGCKIRTWFSILFKWMKVMDVSRATDCFWTSVILVFHSHQMGARGNTVGGSTALQAGRSRVRFPMVSLEFFIVIILSAALWPWGWLRL